MSYIGRLAERTLNLVMIPMADQHQRISLFGELDCLDMDLCDERTGSVDYLQTAALTALADSRRNPMGRVDNPLAVRHVVDLVHENRALLRLLVHNVPVMDNFSPNVDGRSERIECNFDNVDGTDYA